MLNTLKSAAVAIAMGVVAFSAAPAAKALPLITGSFSISGGGSIPAGQTLLTTTELDFNGIVVAGNQGVGDYSSINAGDLGTIVTTFVFDPLGGPINNFLQIDGFSFDLLDVASIFRQHINVPNTPGLDTLTVTSTGTVRHAGFHDTHGLLTITANGTTNGLSVSFSGTGTSPIPEPGTLTLFGAGLVGLSFLRRRRKA